MYDWGALTLFLYIVMRMSGFVLMNPIFGRSGIPNVFKAGMILTLAVSVYANQSGTVPVPGTVVELVLHMLLELGVGLVVSVIMRFFFFIPEQAGEVADTQMGMSMARNYDPSAQASLTTTASLLYALMVLIFFAANGHITLLRVLLTSGDIVPFGAAALGSEIADRVVLLFTDCALLGVKLSLPILAAELLGQVGMGVLMKAIPQLNIFAINIELKVIVGLAMVLLLISPMSEFLLDAESTMLKEVQMALTLLK